MKTQRLIAFLGLPALLVMALLATQVNPVESSVAALAQPRTGQQVVAATTLTPAAAPAVPQSGSAPSRRSVRADKPAYQLPKRQGTPVAVSAAGASLGVGPQVAGAFRAALPAQVGAFKVIIPDSRVSANEVWLTFESQSKAAYVLQVSFQATVTAAAREFDAGKVVADGRVVAMGEGAAINPQGQQVIGAMRYRNVIAYLYASNAFSTADTVPAAQHLTDAQITELFRAVEQALQKQAK